MTHRNPLESQVGGSHYKDCAVQPIEFSMMNGWDACAHSILKYVLRHRRKAGRQDIEKAMHFAQLRDELLYKSYLSLDRSITMEELVDADGITAPDAEALYALEVWVYDGGVGSDDHLADLHDKLDVLLAEYD